MINTEFAIATVKCWMDNTAKGQPGYDVLEMALSALQERLSAGSEPVVHCEDCRHSREAIGDNYFCNRKILGLVRPTDFCSFGESKDGGSSA